MSRYRHTTISIPLAILLFIALAAAHHYRARSITLEQQLASLQTQRPDTAPPARHPRYTAAQDTNSIPLTIPAEQITTTNKNPANIETAPTEQAAKTNRLLHTAHAATAATAAEPPHERSDWLENLREEDPDRYAEIQARRAEAQQRVRDSFARKAAHFLYRDTTTMDEIERAEYEHMLGLLGETWQLAEQMQATDLNREARWEIRREVMQNVRTLTPILEAERDREFYQLAQQLGYDDQRAGQFVDYINDMIEVSTFGSIMRGPRGGDGRY
jgi:hypothetical protein